MLGELAYLDPQDEKAAFQVGFEKQRSVVLTKNFLVIHVMSE